MDSVQSFIEGLPSDEKVIVMRLRRLILDLDPRIQEKLSYGVPYFYHYRRICFLWPISCLPPNYPPPGPGTSKVDFGFCQGNLLSNDHGLMIFEKRKQVGIIKLSSVSDIDETKFNQMLQEAILVDDQFFLKRKKSKA